MDILISSNLERLIYMLTGEDEEANRKLMADLSEGGVYKITQEMAEKMNSFRGGYATEAENADTIRKIYQETGYVTDTHTGVAACVYDKYRKETGDATPSVIVSTASPYKFVRSVMCAIDKGYDQKSDFELLDELEKLSGTAQPNAILEIKNAQILHHTVCEIADMPKTVKDFLGISG